MRGAGFTGVLPGDREEMGREDRSPQSYYLVNVVLLGAGETFDVMDVCVCIGVSQLCSYTRLRPHVGLRGQAQEVLKLHCLIGVVTSLCAIPLGMWLGD